MSSSARWLGVKVSDMRYLAWEPREVEVKCVGSLRVLSSNMEPYKYSTIEQCPKLEIRGIENLNRTRFGFILYQKDVNVLCIFEAVISSSTPQHRPESMGNYEYHDRIIGSLLPTHSSSDLYALDESELWWIGHFEFLKNHGYMMRPRYRPGWKPSYKPGILEPLFSEDGQSQDVTSCLSYHSIHGALLTIPSIPMLWMPFAFQILTWSQWSASRFLQAKIKLPLYFRTNNTTRILVIIAFGYWKSYRSQETTMKKSWWCHGCGR